MKKFKRILTSVFAVILALTMALFAACTPTDNSAVNKEEVEKLVEKLMTQSVTNAELSATGNVRYSEVRTQYDASGAVKNTNNQNETADLTASGKLNLLGGNGDVSLAADDHSGHGIYEYAFLRDWALNTYESEKEITNFAGKELTNYGNLKDAIGDALADTDLTLGQMFSMALVPALSMDLAVANELDAVTKSGDTLTVDGNLMIYNAVQKVYNFLAKLSDETTLRQLLAMDEIKDLLDDSSIDGATMQSTLYAALAEYGATEIENGKTVNQILAEQGITITDIAVPADANSTAYEYIIKVLGSKPLNDLVKKIAEEEELTDVPNVLDLNINYLKPFIGVSESDQIMMSLNMVFAMFTSGITPTECKLTSFGGAADGNSPVNPADMIPVISVSNLKSNYKISGDKLTEQTVSATIHVETPTLEYNGNGWDYSKITVEIDLNLTLKFTDSNYALTDISGCTISYPQKDEEYTH